MKIMRFKKLRHGNNAVYMHMLMVLVFFLSYIFSSAAMAVISFVFYFSSLIVDKSIHSKEILIDKDSCLITIALRFPVTFYCDIGYLKDVHVMSNEGYIPFVKSQFNFSHISFRGEEFVLCDDKYSFIQSVVS